MQMMFQTTEGDITLTEDTELLGVVTGNVTVPSGVHLVMGGLVMGTLIVAGGGSADVNGVVMGHIINDGGTIKLSDEGYAGRISAIAPHGHRAPRPRASFWGAWQRVQGNA